MAPSHCWKIQLTLEGLLLLTRPIRIGWKSTKKRIYLTLDFHTINFSTSVLLMQCVDTKIQRSFSLPWSQIHTVPCHFVSLGLSAIARTFPRASSVPVEPQWTQTTNAASGSAHGRGGREMWSQEEEGLTRENMTIFSGPLGWHGALIHSFAFLLLLSFPQHLMAGKFLNWSHKEGISSKALSALSQMCDKSQGSKVTGQFLVGNSLWGVVNRKTVTLVVPLFSAFTCLLQQPHSPVERASQ